MSNTIQNSPKNLLTQLLVAVSKSKIIMMIVFIVIVKLLYLSSALVSIGPGKVGVVFSKFGKEPAVEGRFIVEKGEKGYWREVLLPGWHFFWLCEPLWKYSIDEYPMKMIKSQNIGFVEALDGTPMPEGDILAADDYIDKNNIFHMGGKGPRLAVLKPGLHPINPKYLKITEKPAIMIPEGKIGVIIRKTGKITPPGMVRVPD